MDFAPATGTVYPIFKGYSREAMPFDPDPINTIMRFMTSFLSMKPYQ